MGADATPRTARPACAGVRRRVLSAFLRSPRLGPLRAHLAHPLERNAYALVVNAVITSVLGLGYWVLAARYYSPEDVGRNSALVSAMLMLASCAQLNLMGAMTHFLPRAGKATARLVRSAYGASSLACAAAAVAFVLVAPRISSNLEFFSGSSALAAAFCLSVVVWGIFAIQDGVLTGLRAAPWVAVENAGFGVVKLILVVGFAAVIPSFGIFASWAIPLLACVLAVNLLIFRRLIPRHVAATQGRALPIGARRVTRFVGGDYVGSLFLQGGTTLLPVLVAGWLGAEANAHFYAAFVVVSAIDVMATNVGASLTVEGSSDRAQLPELTARILRVKAGLVLPAVLVAMLAAPLVLAVFGPGYAEGATTVFRLLALGMLAKALTIVYVSVCRAQGRVGRIVAVQAATCAMVVGGSLALVDSYGITGVGWAWLGGQAVMALAVLRPLHRLLNSKTAARIMPAAPMPSGSERPV